MVSTNSDPIPGWTNNITGINGNHMLLLTKRNEIKLSATNDRYHFFFVGLCIGIGVGFLRHLHVTNDFVIDIICADYVINTTLAAIRFTADKYETTKKIPKAEIYHVTSKGFYLTSGKLLTFFSYAIRPSACVLFLVSV